MDMGFSRDHCLQALLHTGGNIEQATEWLLTHPALAQVEVAVCLLIHYLNL